MRSPPPAAAARAATLYVAATASPLSFGLLAAGKRRCLVRSTGTSGPPKRSRRRERICCLLLQALCPFAFLGYRRVGLGLLSWGVFWRAPTNGPASVQAHTRGLLTGLWSHVHLPSASQAASRCCTVLVISVLTIAKSVLREDWFPATSSASAALRG